MSTSPTHRDPAAPKVTDLLSKGHFARKQLYCRSRLIAWSHRSRFVLARRLVAEFRGAKLLDYGCGDGTFLAMVSDLFPDAVGTDIARDAIDECAVRYRPLDGLRFAHTSGLSDDRFTRSFDLVTCMETLEHCVPRAATAVLNDLRRLVRPGGTVLISVPIEIGPPLLIKHTMRMIAGWRRLGQYQYREKYSTAELMRMLFAAESTAIERPIYDADPSDPATGYHGHKGFNWRRMRRQIAEGFEVKQTRFSPLHFTQGWLSSQAWFLCGAGKPR